MPLKQPSHFFNPNVSGVVVVVVVVANDTFGAVPAAVVGLPTNENPFAPVSDVAAVAVVAVVATPIPYKNCAQPGALMTVSGIDGTFPFKRGVQLNITISGDLGSNTVTAGQYTLEVKLFGVHVFGDQGDLCKYSPTYFHCPATGKVAINVVQTIPQIAPAGQYDIILSAKDNNNKQVLCVDVNTKIDFE